MCKQLSVSSYEHEGSLQNSKTLHTLHKALNGSLVSAKDISLRICPDLVLSDNPESVLNFSLHTSKFLRFHSQLSRELSVKSFCLPLKNLSLIKYDFSLCDSGPIIFDNLLPLLNDNNFSREESWMIIVIFVLRNTKGTETFSLMHSD